VAAVIGEAERAKSSDRLRQTAYLLDQLRKWKAERVVASSPRPYLRGQVEGVQVVGGRGAFEDSEHPRRRRQAAGCSAKHAIVAAGRSLPRAGARRGERIMDSTAA
jgi:hypothetical protein